MKWKGWIGGVLLVMMLFGTLGCGKKRGPVTGGMVDGPGMMYTPEDQSPFAGKWQSRDGSIVMEVESSDPFESSRIQVFVDGEPDFESFPAYDFWWKLSEDGSTQRKPKSCGILRILASVFRFYLNPPGFPSSSRFCPEL